MCIPANCTVFKRLHLNINMWDIQDPGTLVTLPVLRMDISWSDDVTGNSHHIDEQNYTLPIYRLQNNKWCHSWQWFIWLELVTHQYVYREHNCLLQWHPCRRLKADMGMIKQTLCWWRWRKWWWRWPQSHKDDNMAIFQRAMTTLESDDSSSYFQRRWNLFRSNLWLSYGIQDQYRDVNGRPTQSYPANLPKDIIKEDNAAFRTTGDVNGSWLLFWRTQIKKIFLEEAIQMVWSTIIILGDATQHKLIWRLQIHPQLQTLMKDEDFNLFVWREFKGNQDGFSPSTKSRGCQSGKQTHYSSRKPKKYNQVPREKRVLFTCQHLKCEPCIWCVNPVSDVWTLYLMCEPYIWCVNPVSDVWTLHLMCEPCIWCVNPVSTSHGNQATCQR